MENNIRNWIIQNDRLSIIGDLWKFYSNIYINKSWIVMKSDEKTGIVELNILESNSSNHILAQLKFKEYEFYHENINLSQ